MTEFEVGAVYQFNYLWAREQGRGEESGRKERPACLLFRAPADGERLYLFPITSQPPPKDGLSLAIAVAECRLAGLLHPSWIILDEVNIAAASQPHDFASLQPLGRLSRGFYLRLAKAAREAAQQGKLASVRRT